LVSIRDTDNKLRYLISGNLREAAFRAVFSQINMQEKIDGLSIDHKSLISDSNIQKTEVVSLKENQLTFLITFTITKTDVHDFNK